MHVDVADALAVKDMLLDEAENFLALGDGSDG